MKLSLDITELKNFISEEIQMALKSQQKIQQNSWSYYTLQETAQLLQIKTGTLIDKRQPYLFEIEYSQAGKIFWFNKASVEDYIKNRIIKRYKS